MSMRDSLRHESKINADISTSSTGDIAFLLLVFFMVTAVFATAKGLQTDLPDSELPPGVEGDPAVLVEVLADGSMRVDCVSMDGTELVGHLRQLLTAKPGKPLILYPHADSVYRDMVYTYDALLLASAESGRPPELQISTPDMIEEYVAAFGVNPFAAYCGG